MVTVGEESARPALDWALARLAEAGVKAVGRVVQGDPQEMICLHAEAVRADLLVMGAIARGHLDNALIGNTAERILEAVKCDLLVMKPQGFGSPGEV